MSIELIISVVSAVVAVLSTGISVWLARRSEGVGRISVIDSHLDRVRQWADETVAMLVRLVRECRDSAPEADFSDRLAEVRTGLSIQVERGRWFFPNVLRDEHGKAKDPAYRGLRQPVLDAVVAAFDSSDGLTWATRESFTTDLIAAQRVFVSEIQVHLDPNQRYKNYRELVDHYRDLDSSLREESIQSRREWVRKRLHDPGANTP